MLLEQVAEIHDGGAVRAIGDNRANRRMEAISYQSIFHRAIAQVVPMLHAVNA